MEGTPFGRYRLIDRLGHGGMGEVWRAYDTGTSRVVAVKVLPMHLAVDPTFEQRFRREALAAARMNDPHVVPIHDFGEIDGRLFVDMRLVDGRDLGTLLDDGPLPPARAVAIVEQVAKALHAAHQIDLIHRDVKPTNILVDADDFAYLIDFGIARLATDPGLTLTGTAIGTWAYMSPERFDSGLIDARSDVYSLACVLHECLTAQRPFTGDMLEQLVAGHMFHPPPRPSEVTAGVPVAFDDVIATGMAKNPEDRFATATELAAAARAALGSPPAEPQKPTVTHTLALPVDNRAGHQTTVVHAPPAEPTSGRNRLLAVAASAIVLVAVVVATTVLVNRFSTTESTPSTTTGESPPPAYGPAVVLPFRGVDKPAGLTVDAAGNLFAVDTGNGRVVKLAPGVGQQPEVVVTGLDQPGGIAVDGAGSLFVTEWGRSRVVVVAPGSTEPAPYPVDGLGRPGDVAVDTAGNLYVADTPNSRILLVAAADRLTSELAFTGLDRATAVAVDTDGDVYVADTYHDRVVKLTVGTGRQTELPFVVSGPRTVAVDGAGTVYVATAGGILTLAPGQVEPTEIVVPGLRNAQGLRVDAAGNVYASEWIENGRVLKLPKT